MDYGSIGAFPHTQVGFLDYTFINRARSTIHAYTRLARCPQSVGDLLSALKVSVTAVTALKGTSVPDCHTLALENSQWTLHYQELEGSSCFISFTGKKGRKYAFSWPLTSWARPTARPLFFQAPGKKKKCQNWVIKTVVFKVIQWIYSFRPASAFHDCIWRYCQPIRNLHLKPLINVKARAKCPCPALLIGQQPERERLRTDPSLMELNYNPRNCT